MTTSYKIENKPLVLDESFFTGKKYDFFRDIPTEDRPREKLTKYGPAALSVPELVAVVLGTGTIKEDVLSMSSRIVKDYGERTLANQTDAKSLATSLDIPLAKALQVVACAELGRRFFDRKGAGRQVIRTARDVYQYLRDMRTLPKEHLRGIYLNTHHRVIHDEVISIGTLDANIVHPREVFRPAIEHGAAAVVLAHNHPSGIVTPSAADIEITKNLVAAGKMVGIPVIDHVVIGEHKFISIDIEY